MIIVQALLAPVVAAALGVSPVSSHQIQCGPVQFADGTFSLYQVAQDGRFPFDEIVASQATCNGGNFDPNMAVEVDTGTLFGKMRKDTRYWMYPNP